MSTEGDPYHVTHMTRRQWPARGTTAHRVSRRIRSGRSRLHRWTRRALDVLHGLASEHPDSQWRALSGMLLAAYYREVRVRVRAYERGGSHTHPATDGAPTDGAIQERRDAAVDSALRLSLAELGRAVSVCAYRARRARAEDLSRHVLDLGVHPRWARRLGTVTPSGRLAYHPAAGRMQRQSDSQETAERKPSLAARIRGGREYESYSDSGPGPRPAGGSTPGGHLVSGGAPARDMVPTPSVAHLNDGRSDAGDGDSGDARPRGRRGPKHLRLPEHRLRRVRCPACEGEGVVPQAYRAMVAWCMGQHRTERMRWVAMEGGEVTPEMGFFDLLVQTEVIRPFAGTQRLVAFEAVVGPKAGGWEAELMSIAGGLEPRDVECSRVRSETAGEGWKHITRTVQWAEGVVDGTLRRRSGARVRHIPTGLTFEERRMETFRECRLWAEARLGAAVRGVGGDRSAVERVEALYAARVADLAARG